MHRALVTLGPFLAFCGICAVAQPKFGAPLIGVARDGQKQIRLVDGVAGNFVLRDAIDGKALDWAFAGRGLVKTDRELLVVGATGAVFRRRAAPSGDAVLSPEAAFFPATGALWQIGAEKDHATQVQPEVVAQCGGDGGEPEEIGGRGLRDRPHEQDDPPVTRPRTHGPTIGRRTEIREDSPAC